MLFAAKYSSLYFLSSSFTISLHINRMLIGSVFFFFKQCQHFVLVTYPLLFSFPLPTPFCVSGFSSFPQSLFLTKPVISLFLFCFSRFVLETYLFYYSLLLFGCCSFCIIKLCSVKLAFYLDLCVYVSQTELNSKFLSLQKLWLNIFMKGSHHLYRKIVKETEKYTEKLFFIEVFFTIWLQKSF